MVISRRRPCSPLRPPNEASWIQFEYSQPQRICGLSIGFVFKNGEERRVMALTSPAVEASDDGKEFRFVADIPWALAQFPVRTIAFPAVTAKFFRVTFKTPSKEASAVGARISELAFRSYMPINRFETKAAFGREGNLLYCCNAAGRCWRRDPEIRCGGFDRQTSLRRHTRLDPAAGTMGRRATWLFAYGHIESTR